MIKKLTLTLAVCTGLFAINADAQKLIARTHAKYHTSGSTTEDSLHYYHSGTKSNAAGKYKIPEFEVMEDSMHTFRYNATTKQKEWVGRRVTTYTGSDFNQSIDYEMNNGTWRNNVRTTIKYSGGKPDTVLYESWSTQSNSWRNSSRIYYTWSGNNILTRTRQTYSFGGGGNPPGWRNNRLHTYTWNGNNETSYIDAKWSSGAWEDSIKRETTYAAGKKSQVNWFKKSGSNWVDDVRYVYNYDGNSRVTVIQQDIYTGTWQNDNGRDTFIYTGTKAQPDTMVRVGKIFPPNFTNIGKWGYEYLPDGRITSESSLSWDGKNPGSWIRTNDQDTTNRWYYGWNVNVEDVQKDANLVKVYPSPASDVISISMDGLAQGNRVEFIIMDMHGRLIKNWSGEVQPVTTMTVSELPAGTYILRVSDGKQITQNTRFTVVR